MAQIIIACLFLWVCLLCLLFYFIGLPHFTLVAIPLCCWLTDVFFRQRVCAILCCRGLNAADRMTVLGANKNGYNDCTKGTTAWYYWQLSGSYFFCFMCWIPPATVPPFHVHVLCSLAKLSCGYTSCRYFLLNFLQSLYNIFIYITVKFMVQGVKLSVHRHGCALCHAQSGVVAEIVWQAVSYGYNGYNGYNCLKKRMHVNGDQ